MSAFEWEKNPNTNKNMRENVNQFNFNFHWMPMHLCRIFQHNLFHQWPLVQVSEILKEKRFKTGQLKKTYRKLVKFNYNQLILFLLQINTQSTECLKLSSKISIDSNWWIREVMCKCDKWMEYPHFQKKP